MDTSASPTERDDMSVQIKTPEGILTLSNATDVRGSNVMVVRGHKGLVLGFIAPLPKGGWVAASTIEDADDLVANTQPGTPAGLPLEAAAASLAR